MEQPPDDKNRIFVVRMSDIAEPYWPTAISDQKGYCLWERAPTTGRVVEISMDFDRTGRPDPVCKQLADDIWNRLNQFFPQHKKWKRDVGDCFERVNETTWRELPVIEGDLIFQFEERATFRGVVDLYDASRPYGIRLYSDRADLRHGDGYFTKYYEGTWNDS